MKRVAIIGGGVAGLSAGIYAQMCGLESVIYEQHTIAGGELTGWERGGCHIDNCVHWMTGTSPDSELYNVWREVGALTGAAGETVQNEAFLKVDTSDGTTLSLWQDLDRLHDDMVAVSPEDRTLIDRFIKEVKAYRCVDLPSKFPAEQIPLRETWRLLKRMRGVAKIHKRCRTISIGDYAAQFRSDAIRKMLTAYFPPQYNVSSLMYVLAIFSNGNAALPRGGSLAMARRMEERYRSLGGKVCTGHKAVKIDVEGLRARRVLFANGKTAEADCVVCACDTAVTFRDLIGRERMDKVFRLWYGFKYKYPVHSSVNLYFDVADGCGMLPDTSLFECEPYIVAGRKCDTILVKNFNGEPSFAPEGHTVIQTLHLQYAGEYEFWSRLRLSDIAAYRKEKERVAGEVMRRIEAKYPELAGKMRVVEAVTPASFNRYCGAYKGSYMSFILTPYVPKIIHRGVLKGLDNLYLAGQWLQPPGGLPNAVLTGKFAIQRLCRREHIPFVGYGVTWK